MFFLLQYSLAKMNNFPILSKMKFNFWFVHKKQGENYISPIQTDLVVYWWDDE